MAEQRYSFNYAVFRYIKDAKRDLSVPIGVALWSQDFSWARVRFIQDNERVAGVNKTTDLPYVQLVARKVNSWLSQRKAPYLSGDVTPERDQWWQHIRNILVHKVKISEARSIDCINPERELELLFRDVVRGLSDQEEHRGRIDHIVLKCLGTLASQFEAGEVHGFAGKPVKVMRHYLGTNATVIIEGVNLSSENAPDETDALVGRLERVRANGHGPLVDSERPVVAVVGYLSSPGGLNGETYLKEWIEQRGQATALDVERETERLRTCAQLALDQAGPPPALMER
jgi:DUF3037 family protein